ncbi:hypothetical protein SAMN04488697_106328 [Pseudomonas sp. 43mfcvi1.1]|jgi:hypothetical protein|uniref:hypothetical protein n=1 Tax=Pseudomonas sp. 43mfcvi1.1 TaxID=1761894 RepID=UPI000D6AFE65|nr:hypothetical protein [Pseudomonas sp. 43mfcvi1.1]PWJ36499.1 hypothetical protein ATJ40_106328 [Pseudomonas sp. 43mfcvi1.1]SSB97064.1 hypothetical protein SAMN04488697_106328 [Pseudomonas sp. 43mfcvi1.1]
MNLRKSLVLRTCAWITLISVSGLATVACAASEQDTTTNSSFGTIHFNNDKGEEKCSLAIPETNNWFNFSHDNQYCENNMVSTFWLENVPSATLINFYENDACSDAKVSNTFFFKFKTVKQPTDWAPHGGMLLSIDALRNLRPGELIAGKNLRVEADGAFVGPDLAAKNLNERLSCVYIERSQPAN